MRAAEKTQAWMLSIGHAKQSAWVQGSCCFSVDKDGTRSGMDVELINKISKENVPIIASGVGKSSHVRDAVIDNNVKE